MCRRALLVALVMVGTLACDKDWRTDMYYSPAPRAEDMPRLPPAKSIALGSKPLLEDREDADDVKDPVPADARSLKHGEWLFSQRCACCHGADAKGGGPVSKLFPPAPDLTYEKISARSDGYIYGTILLGGRAMPSQAEGLTERDRWDLVNYVRKVEGVSK